MGQTALALVLLVASGLLLRSFQELRSVDPGYDVEDVFTFQMAPEAERLVDGPSWVAFRDAPQPLVYLPMTGQGPDLWALSSPAYVVKTERAEQIAPEIRALVSELAPEIGVRMALGARAGGVRRMVVAQGGRLVVIGVLAGALAALAATQLLETLLFGVDAVDPVTFVAGRR